MKIYLTGAENIGWALDTDIAFAKESLRTFAKISRCAAYSDYIHSVSPNTTYKRFAHHGDRFISVFQGEPKRIFEKDSSGFFDFCKDKICIAQSKQALNELLDYNIKSVRYIPYIADLKNYYYIKDKETLRRKYNLGDQKFIIGSFMRDSLGTDLDSPKLEKGPDIFVEIIKQVCEKIGYDQILVLLGGPRRHWIRKALEKEKIQYMFIGTKIEVDDMNINNLPPYTINELINISDLILISSRSEGGPRGILEAAAAYTPVISSDVGLAGDVLNKSVIYNDTSEAAEMVMCQFYKKEYDPLSKENYENVKNYHSLEYISGLWKDFYGERAKQHSNSKHYTISINDFDRLYAIKQRIIRKIK